MAGEPLHLETHGIDLGYVELYRYPPGPGGEVPKHAHAEYQFCFSVDFPGEYNYRGERHPVPVQSVSVIHPGEVHAARDLDDRQHGATFMMMYVTEASMRATVAELNGGRTNIPFFSTPVIVDSTLAAEYSELHEGYRAGAPRLRQETRWIHWLGSLAARRGLVSSGRAATANDSRSVDAVRQFLDASPDADISLEQLSEVSGLSRYHLVRLFTRQVGLPPHRYHLGVRVNRAKTLLLDGRTPGDVAAEMGFFDQSHLNRHFRRLVGVTAGTYGRAARTS
ncbi:MAG: helix-turn-helix domain-containing protein [Actinomycetota bacterium]